MMQFSETVHVFFMVLVICLVCGKQLASALTINDFYPFGPLYGDSQLDDGVDVLSSQVTFPAPFSFFGESFPEVVVLTSGPIALRRGPVHVDDASIIPYSANADTTNGVGNVYYRITANQTLLNQAAQTINSTFGDTDFMPQYLMITTWFQIGYFQRNSDKTNTFQAVLIATNVSSYILFLYEEGGIQWTTADNDGGVNGLGGSPAKATLSIRFANSLTADMRVNIEGSGTPDIINISSTTNANRLGLWAFRVDQAQITVPDPCLFQPGPCDPNANCRRDALTNQMFTCICRPPFTVGDGFNCTVPDPCFSDPCHVNASCNREGLLSEEFTCTCDSDFTGDGYNCTEVKKVEVRDKSNTATIIAVILVLALIATMVVVTISIYFAYTRKIQPKRHQKPVTDSEADRPLQLSGEDEKFSERNRASGFVPTMVEKYETITTEGNAQDNKINI